MATRKEYQPPVFKKVLPRPRFFNFMEEKHVVVIQGKAGQGKTTLVSDYINSEGRMCIWYNMSSRDLNPEYFLNTLEKYIHIYCHGLFQKSTRTSAGAPKDIEILTQNFIDNVQDSFPEGLTIVLDQLEIINQNPEVCRIVEILLNRLSPGTPFILISREPPRLSLTKIRSRKELIELHDKDLDFSREELQALLYEVYDMNLDSITIDRIHEMTGGWITGIIYLIEKVCCLDKEEAEKILDNFLGGRGLPEIDDYFLNEILDPLEAERKRILVKMGILPEITPDLIEILNTGNGNQIIKELLAVNLFLRQTERDMYSYVFNPLFRNYLERLFHLELAREERRDAHKAIAEFYIEDRNYEKAIRAFCMARDYERAQEVFVGYVDELFRKHELEHIRKLIEIFPPEMVKEDIYLSYYNAIAFNLVQPDTSRKKLLNLLPVFRNLGDHDKEANIYYVLLSNYFFYQTNPEAVEGIVKMAEEFLAGTGQGLSSNKQELLAAMIPLGLWWSGRAKEKAFEAALRAEETSHKINNSEAYLCARLVLAKIYLEKGEFKEAKNLLVKTEALFKDDRYKALSHYQCLISFYLGDTCFYLGETGQALNQVQKGLNMASPDFAFRPYLQLNMVYYNLYTENIEQAERLYDQLRIVETGENFFLQYNIDYLFQMLMAYRNRNKRRAEYYCHRLMEPENKSLLSTDLPFSYHAMVEVSLFNGEYKEALGWAEHLSHELNPFRSKGGKESDAGYPYSDATIMALKGLIYTRMEEEEEAKKCFDTLKTILREKEYRNLDICDPLLISELAEVSQLEELEEFPRLAGDREIDTISPKGFKMEIQTLGAFKVLVKGKEISANLLGGQKRVMDLLKLLIVFRKNGVMKERIYGLFWPRYSYKSARDNLNTIIYRLRKLLNDKDELFSTDIHSIRFKEGSTITDVDIFLDYLEKGKEAENNGNNETALKMYQTAVGLYKGDFLETDLYFDFIRDERENLRNKYRNLLFKMTKLCLAITDYHKAIEWGKLLIDTDPLCEAGYRLLMIGCAFAGNKSEIPRLYDKLNKKLQAYYKVSADEKTQELKEILLSGQLPEEARWKNETII